MMDLRPAWKRQHKKISDKKAICHFVPTREVVHNIVNIVS